MLSSPPRSRRSCCTAASRLSIARSSRGSPSAISMPTALLSSSTSPIAATRASALLTRLPSPRPVVPPSPVRVAMAERRLPMVGSFRRRRRSPRAQHEQFLHLDVAAGRRRLAAVAPVLVRYAGTHGNGVVEPLHGQAAVVHADAALQQCQRRFGRLCAARVAGLRASAGAQGLLHVAKRRPGHRSGPHMLRRYWPPTSNSALLICPSEQTRTASISTWKTLPLAITACCRR